MNFRTNGAKRHKTLATAFVATTALILSACGSSGSDGGDAMSTIASAAPSGTSTPATDTTSKSPESSSQDQQSEAPPEECTDPDNIDFVLNWIRNYNQIPMTVADHEGFYKDECLNVTIQPGEGSSSTVQAVAAGAAQIGISDTIAIIQGQLKDLPVTGVGVEWVDSTFAIIVRNDALGGISPDDFKLSDLYGKMHGAVTTGSPYIFWKALATQNNLDLSKITEVSVSAPGYAELVSKRVDFITNLAGAIPVVKSAGGDATAFLGSDFGLNTYGMAIFANNDWLKDHADAMTRFLRATAKGMVWTADNPEAAIDILASYGGSTAGQLEALKAVLPYWSPSGTETPEQYLHFTDEGISNTTQVLYDGGVVTGEPEDVTDRWTTEYLPDPSTYLSN